MLHGLLPLSLAVLTAGPAATIGPDARPKYPKRRAVAAVASESSPPREFNVDVQKDWIQRALAMELRRNSLLDDFQVVTSKFSNGRVALTDIQIAPGPREGTARLTVFAELRFRRHQLGMKWRGFKSHKKWFEKGEKHVATARVSAVVSIAARPSKDGLSVRLNELRAKITGHLRPARGVVVRFDIKDQTHSWVPEDRTWIQRILAYAFELRDARISKVTATAIEVTLRGATPEGASTPTARK